MPAPPKPKPDETSERRYPKLSNETFARLAKVVVDIQIEQKLLEMPTPSKGIH